MLFSTFQLLGAFCTLQLYWSIPKRHDLLVLGGYLLFSTFQLYWVPLALCNNIGCVPKRHDLLVLGGYLFFSTFQLHWVPLALCNDVGCDIYFLALSNYIGCLWHFAIMLGAIFVLFLKHTCLIMPLDDGDTLKMLLELQ